MIINDHEMLCETKRRLAEKELKGVVSPCFSEFFSTICLEL
jgi:hypothetical protein